MTSDFAPLDDRRSEAGVPDPTVAEDDQVSPEITELICELKLLRASKRSLVANLIALAITIFLFYALGVFRNPGIDIVMLIVVLLIHEMGHYVAMRWFGYQDVRMFFIPLFGAAVQGYNPTAAGWKRAVVALMGPVPGILIGIVVGIAYVITRQPLLGSAAAMFLLLNVFNLLPFFPLDGGRLLNDVLFCRSPAAELLIRFVGGAALGLMGYGMGAWILCGFGVLIMLTCRHAYRVARLGKNLRERLIATDVSHAADLPPSVLQEVASAVRASIPVSMPPKNFAIIVSSVWEKAVIRPPSVLATLMLLAVYGGFLVLPCVAGGIAAVVSRTTRYVAVEDDGSGVVEKEQVYAFGVLLTERGVSTDKLYHGRYMRYWLGTTKVRKVGNWDQGRWHGTWKEYDQQGRLIRESVFDQGAFVSHRELTNDGWVEKDLESMGSAFRRAFDRQSGPPRGPSQ